MEAIEGAAVEYTSDGEISEQMSATVKHSLRKLGKRKINNENEELAKDLNFYQTCLSAICEHSPSAKVFCLIHKRDLVAQDQRQKLFEDRQNDLIKISNPVNITCYMSSIWDESLYMAWSSIINRLNVQKPEETMDKFTYLMECNELQK
ncbi:ras-related GTP-binding protein A-like [Acyrthosiphon pisum]|uniref:Uncharacterized protein n=1 Tax=Acyrthosiphon pisum TaxID=7029 RepID=A0A8R2AY10_ACYPI|nr:ras-related GTP-binding protein A-like [Acyrthosiphon pisum]|eukprot:XP_008178652.1 PREDICTED: ras-related GTP-binding protein A-like [Acyrthosiphon pisum]